MPAKVLVVDDERDAVELMTINLRTAGYEVVAAADGMEALHLARQHRPDVILLDLMLPDIDGFSICEILRGRPPTAGIPIILLTAMAGEIPRLHGLEVGATDYCFKPVCARDLMNGPSPFPLQNNPVTPGAPAILESRFGATNVVPGMHRMYRLTH